MNATTAGFSPVGIAPEERPFFSMDGSNFRSRRSLTNLLLAGVSAAAVAALAFSDNVRDTAIRWIHNAAVAAVGTFALGAAAYIGLRYLFNRAGNTENGVTPDNAATIETPSVETPNDVISDVAPDVMATAPTMTPAPFLEDTVINAPGFLRNPREYITTRLDRLQNFFSGAATQAADALPVIETTPLRVTPTPVDEIGTTFRPPAIDDAPTAGLATAADAPPIRITMPDPITPTSVVGDAPVVVADAPPSRIVTEAVTELGDGATLRPTTLADDAPPLGTVTDVAPPRIPTLDTIAPPAVIGETPVVVDALPPRVNPTVLGELGDDSTLRPPVADAPPAELATVVDTPPVATIAPTTIPDADIPTASALDAFPAAAVPPVAVTSTVVEGSIATTAIDEDLLSIANAGDEAAQLAAVDDVVADFQTRPLAEMAQEMRALQVSARASRAGSNAPLWIGAGIGVTALAATAYLSEMQRVFIERLAAEHDGALDAARDSYLDLNSTNQAIISGDIAVGMADPTFVIGAAATFFAERSTYGSYENWISLHEEALIEALGPEGAQQAIQALSMSLFTPDTVTQEIRDGFLQRIPQTTEGHSEILHDVIAARQEYSDAFSRIQDDIDYGLLNRSFQGWERAAIFQESSTQLAERLEAAIEDGNEGAVTILTQMVEIRSDIETSITNLDTELSTLLSSREGMQAYLGLFEASDLEDTVSRLMETPALRRDAAIDTAEDHFNNVNMALYASYNVNPNGAVGYDAFMDGIDFSVLDAYGDDTVERLRAGDEDLFNSILSQERQILEDAESAAHAAYEGRLDEIAVNHPEIVAYTREYGFFNRQTWRVLEQNPELMSAFILDQILPERQDGMPANEATPEVPNSTLGSEFGLMAHATPDGDPANTGLDPDRRLVANGGTVTRFDPS